MIGLYILGILLVFGLSEEYYDHRERERFIMLTPDEREREREEITQRSGWYRKDIYAEPTPEELEKLENEKKQHN